MFIKYDVINQISIYLYLILKWIMLESTMNFTVNLRWNVPLNYIFIPISTVIFTIVLLRNSYLPVKLIVNLRNISNSVGKLQYLYTGSQWFKIFFNLIKYWSDNIHRKQDQLIFLSYTVDLFGKYSWYINNRYIFNFNFMAAFKFNLFIRSFMDASIQVTNICNEGSLVRYFLCSKINKVN